MKLYLTALFAVISVTSSCSKNEESNDQTAGAQASQESTYPLDSCVVSGEKLGSMGTPIVIQHEGTEVRFCCKSCIKKFKKNPSKYLVKLQN